jgi:sucrose-6F-phosphate phosphohydrolase
MVIVYYHTSWSPAFIHTSYEGSWRSLPLSRHPTRHNWQQIQLASLSEFVFTDGQHQWDNPSPGQNYRNPGCAALAVYRGAVLPVLPSEPILLISDLDNTLIGSHPDTQLAQRKFNEYWISKHYFGKSKLVYSTGRSLEEYLQLGIDGYKMLAPDMLITAVGSDAYTLDIRTGTFVNHIDFHRIYDGEVWDSEVMAKLVHDRFPWLIIPDRRYIYPFKIWMTCLTSDLDLHKADLKTFLKNAENAKRNGLVIHARAIISGCGDYRYVDITPRIGGKRMGVRYAQQYFHFDNDRTIVAGDSGNDIEMFRDSHFGVVVENADGEMTAWLEKKMRKNKFRSNFKWADAVVDGVERVFYRSE